MAEPQIPWPVGHRLHAALQVGHRPVEPLDRERIQPSAVGGEDELDHRPSRGLEHHQGIVELGTQAEHLQRRLQADEFHGFVIDRPRSSGVLGVEKRLQRADVGPVELLVGQVSGRGGERPLPLGPDRQE